MEPHWTIRLLKCSTLKENIDLKIFSQQPIRVMEIFDYFANLNVHCKLINPSNREVGWNCLS